jgi:hypothetical protein
MADTWNGAREAEAPLERFMRALIDGDRAECRSIVARELAAGRSARGLLESLAWPACTILDGLSRRDAIGAVARHSATLLLAQMTERIGARLERRRSFTPAVANAPARRVLVFSGPSPLEELAANIFVLLAESEGLAPHFLGGGVESDELFAEIGRERPAAVVGYAVAAADGPRIRRLLRMLAEHEPVRDLRVGGGGGLFSRVPGLAEEFGLHFGGESPFDLVDALTADLEAADSNGGVETGLTRMRREGRAA